MEHGDVLRLNTSTCPDGATKVSVEGRLVEDTLREFEQLCSSDAAPADIVLHLAGLTAIDRAGRDALMALRLRGVRMSGASLYVRHLLGEVIS